ncbi:bcl-2-binding component 3 isoform X2 [Ambystoma mexicanum]
MARPFQDGSPPEQVESLPNDGTRPRPSETIAQASYFPEDCDLHAQDPHLYCSGCQTAQTGYSAPPRTLCSFPMACSGHTVYDRRSIVGEHPRPEQVAMAGLGGRVDEDMMMGNGVAHREQPGQDIERQIAARLRMIGDEMNTIYLQRAMEQEVHRVPLIWHLYHFITEVFAVFFNPQGDMVP